MHFTLQRTIWWQVAHDDYIHPSGHDILFSTAAVFARGSTDLGQPVASSFTFGAFPAIGGTSLTFPFQLHLLSI